jgi:hypothetical protein
MPQPPILVNRAPVLTLWAAVVAERLGYKPHEALTLGKAVAGLNAQAKGRSLGIYRQKEYPEGKKPPKHGLGEELWVHLCGRAIPCKHTPAGLRAVVKDQPIDPASVQTYLAQKFKDALDPVRTAMASLAAAYEPDQLAELAFSLYERFRPAVAPGQRGWGQAGPLDLSLLRELARQAPTDAP